MSGRSDCENVRDSTLDDDKTALPSLSPLSLSSCARMVQFSTDTSPTKVNICNNTNNDAIPSLGSPQDDSTNNFGGFKLDLPLVYNSLKFIHFRGTTAVSCLVTLRRRIDLSTAFEKVNLEERLLGVSKAGVATPNLDASVNKLRHGHSEKKRRETVLHQINEDYHSRKKVTKSVGTEKDNAWKKLLAIFHWTEGLATTITDDNKGNLRNGTQMDDKAKLAYQKELADCFSVPPSRLLNFQFDEGLGIKWEEIIHKLRGMVHHLVYPDLLKMIAFREWQNDKGNLNKCAYYLAEAHGTHLRTDLIDKHCLFFCKKEESTKTEVGSPPADDKLRKKVFVRQIKDAITFGKKFDDFSACLNDINPNWNVVQISALTFSNNRFGSEAAEYRVTPPIFLSTFVHLHGDARRSCFVNYIKEPVPNPASRMGHGILEEFRKVMTKNKHINDVYNGSRTKYWDIRAEHNKHLSDVLEAIETNWLAPYSFLLPGNVKSSSLQSKIMSKVTDIHSGVTKLNDQERIFLYKLMENYRLVDSCTKSHLKQILETHFKISSKKAGLMLEIVTNCGESMLEEEERWPTILILDQELEQLPWDWLPSLRTTSVTRMASIAAIYSAIKVVNISRPRYPAIVDTSKGTFILNPDGTLANVQKRLEAYLKAHKKWKGIIARKPTFQEMEHTLLNHDIMLYCGHGSGINFFPDFALQKLLCNAIPILMGCSSAQYRYHGPKANSSSVVTSYLIAACPSIVGFLWEVTDAECDRVTVDMLQRWAPGPTKLPAFPNFDTKLHRPQEKCLATAVLRSRKAATQFLTEAALVNYGLPIETK